MEMLHCEPPCEVMLTVTASPGWTVQLASPERLVIGVSAAGRISYHA